jgi:FK506-binding nuclear protein
LKNFQQPLDITVGEHEQVYFSSNGTHDIYLTGNYVLPPDFTGDEDDEDDYDSDEMDYDLSPDEDELEDVSDSEEDALDALQDPRVTEVDSDEEEAPKLIEANGKKGKNKRPAESDDDATLDDLIKKSEPVTNGETKLSKKQAKKLKKNDGQAAAAAQEAAKKDTPSSDKKKVQFAKNLEQGPTGSPKVEAPKEEGKKEKAGPRNVQGVTIDDKKIGKGQAAKKGSRVEMRYIGKLKNGKQFDCEYKFLSQSFSVANTCPSKQEGQAILLQARRRRSHPRLGHRCRWHHCRW